MPKYSEEANRQWPYLLPKVERVAARFAKSNGNGGGIPATPALSFFDLTDVDSAGWDNGEVPTWDVTTSTFKPTLPAGGGGGLTYVEGPGIDISGTLISAVAHATRGIIVDSGGIGVKGKVDGGLAADVDGLYIHPKTHSGLVIDSGGIGVGAGDGIDVAGTLVKVDVSDIAGFGLEDDGANNLTIHLADVEAPGLGFDAGGGFMVLLDAPSGLVKTVDGLALGTPGLLAYNSTSATTTSSHTHDMDADDDVTSGTSKLLHSLAGKLRLKALDLNGDLDFIGATRNILADESLWLKPDVDLWLDPGGVVRYPDGQESRTLTFQDTPAGILGFQLADWSAIEYAPGVLGANTMGLKLNYLKVDNLFARKFTADEVRVQRGEWYLTRSYGIVEEDAVVPAIGATVDIWFEEAPGLGSFKLFLPNNWLQFRTIDLATGLVIQTVFFQVVDAGANDYVARLPQDENKVARQKWRLRRRSGGFTGEKIKKGEVAADFGQPRHEEVPGSGIWTPAQGAVYATSLWDSDGPFIQTQTFDRVGNDAGGNPFIPVFKLRTRMGNLKSTVDYTGEIYGFVAGDDLSIPPSGGFRGIAVDAVYGARLFNTDVHLYEEEILSVGLTRDMGLAIRNDTTPFATDVRTIAFYDDLQVDAGTKLMTVGTATAKIGSWGDVDDRRLQLSSFGTDWAAVSIQAVGDGGGDEATVIAAAGGWYGKIGGIITLNAHYVNHVTGDDSPRFRIGGDSGTFAKSNLHVYTTEFVNNDSVGILHEAAGTSDAMMHWQIAGGQQFVAGIDRTDGNWKIEPGNHLGTGTPAIVINPTTGVVTINGLVGSGTGTLTATGGDGIDLVGTDIRVDGTVVRNSRAITAGDGLGGGGDLSANRSFYVDSTVVRTTRLITTAGALRGGRDLGSTVPLSLALATNSGLNQTAGLAVDAALAGSGLTLTAGVLSVDSDIIRGDAVEIVAGAGLIGGGLLNTALVTLSVKVGSGILIVDDAVTVDPDFTSGAAGIIVAGAGLTGGGDLETTGSVTLNIAVGPDLDVATDAILVKSTIARSATQIMAGAGLIGGGDLSADRTLSLDPTAIVSASRQIIAGAGLQGGGSLAADVTLDVNPGFGIEVVADLVRVNTTSTYAWTGAHSWNQAITVSGALNFSGNSRQITTELAGHYLALRPKGDLLIDPTAGNSVIESQGIEVRSETQSDAVSGITGHRLWWPSSSQAQLTITGLKSDSLYTRFFVADEVRINRGEEFWSKSYGIVETEFTLPALFNTRDIYIENVPTISGRVFADGDRLQCRVIDWGTGLTVATLWFAVVTYLGLESAARRQQYRLQLTAIGGLSAGFVIPKGTVLVDFGVVGQGMIHLNALRDGGGPWLQFGRMNVAGNTPTFLQHVRVGQLSGTIDYGSLDRWGIVAGNNIGTSPSAGFSGFAADDVDGMRMFNTAFVLYNAGASVLLVEKTNGISIKYGSSAFNSIGWYESLGTAMAPNPTQLRVQLNPKKVAPTWSQFDITSYGRSEDAYTRGVVRVTGQNSAGTAYNVWVDDGGVYFGSGTSAQAQSGGYITNATTYIAGNVGVGTTTFGTVNTKMEVRGGSVTNLRLGRLAHPNLRSDWQVNANGVAINAIDDSDTTYKPFTIAGKPIIFAIDGTENMRVHSDGSVGIGTAAPDYMLHVSKIQNTTTGILAENTSGNTAAQAGLLARNDAGAVGSLTVLGSAVPGGSYYTGNDALLAATAGKLVLRTVGNHHMIFATNNVEEMRLTAAGNLGIGNTNPGANLHVGPGVPTLVPNPGGVWVAPNTTIAMLHMMNTLGQEAGIMVHSNANTYMGNWSNHDLMLRTNNIDRLSITAAGNVGISDSSPTFKLDVNGTLRAVGLMSANAGISFGDETLSTYDEGTYTPTLQATSGTVTFTAVTQTGKYTKIGNFVMFHVNLTYTTRAGGTGTIYITLPFAAAAGIDQVFTGLYEGGTPASQASSFYVLAGASRASITPTGAATLTVSNIAAQGDFRFSAVYYCA